MSRYYEVLGLAILIFFCIGYGIGSHHEKVKYDLFVQQQTNLGLLAKQAADKENQKHEQVLKEVSNGYTKRLPEVEARAVARYRAAHPSRVLYTYPSASGVSQAGQGAQGTNDSCSEPVATDRPTEGFILDCAADALKVVEWQSWASKNQLEVE